jgi:hypothetical protein
MATIRQYVCQGAGRRKGACCLVLTVIIFPAFLREALFSGRWVDFYSESPLRIHMLFDHLIQSIQKTG